MFSVVDRSGKVGRVEPETRTDDSGGWDSLVRRHYQRVFVSLLAMGLGPESARELCQAAWARLFEQHSAGALDRLELPGLAIRQARFLALDYRRREGAERKRIRDSIDITQVVSSGDVERDVVNRELLDRALGALGQCTPTEQNVFRLLYSRPVHSQRAAAAELGLSLQRVRQVLCELRKKIRNAISEA